MKPVPIVYFSDLLCIWAYIAQFRVNELKAVFGDQIRIEPRFCSVFGDTARKIPAAWKDKGGYQGFNAHLRHVAEQFPEIPVSPELWLSVRPASSMSPHLFVCAVRLHEQNGGCSAGAADNVAWALRRAFFETAADIASLDVQRAIAEQVGLDLAVVEAHLRDGRAHAALASDYQDAEAAQVHGSPSFVLNEGRQTLYGNVGYRVLEANIQELLRTPPADSASWC